MRAVVILTKEQLESNLFEKVLDEDGAVILELEKQEELFVKVYNDTKFSLEIHDECDPEFTTLRNLVELTLDLARIFRDIRWLVMINDGTIEQPVDQSVMSASELIESLASD